MDNKQPSPFLTRPIILSPPPLEEFPSKRQPSVGYNLQHEFETLNQDLDLDLTSQRGQRGQQQGQGQMPQPQGEVQSQMQGQQGQSLHNQDPSSGSIHSNPHMGTNPSQVGHSSGNSASSTLPFSPVPDTTSQAGLESLLNQNFLPPSFSLPNRPQSVNDSNLFKSNQTNFYLELIRFTSWIETLNPQDSTIMIDYLCNNLPMDFLFSFKSKLENHFGGSRTPGMQQGMPGMLGINGNPYGTSTNSINIGHQSVPQVSRSEYSSILSPYNHSSQPEPILDMENLSLHDEKVLHQPKPKQNIYHRISPSKPSTSRPRSADPNIQKHPMGSAQHQFERAKSPTSHLFEKTNFLQLAAAQSPGLQAQQHNSDESLDMSQKLGALTTINSRVALDSNKRFGGFQQPQPQQQNQQQPFGGPQYYHDQINRSLNSSSVPVGKGIKSPNMKSRKGNVSPLNIKDTVGSSNSNDFTGGNSPNSGTSNSSMPSDVTNPDYLNNIPAWLKLLRLHKYTECLKDVYWKDLVLLEDPQLEERGVKALGARRKLLKAFDIIKAHYTI